MSSDVLITIDPECFLGPIKPMNCVNNGPAGNQNSQCRSNFDTYAALKIPFARTHDASFYAGYGGEHTVDVAAVFPDFDRDPDDPSAYDFVLTDEYLQRTIAAGTQIFYRLGTKIEHWKKKYNTLPPRDFRKWAQICEHIIRHCNEGWADGFRGNIRWWEIWNEPDIDLDDDKDKRCWGGTAAQFRELYRITSVHLKTCFPDLMIGGPAQTAQFDQWMDDFLALRTPSGERIPLDFYSWHQYTEDPMKLQTLAEKIRRKLDAAGYKKTLSILDEYNYIRDWKENFVYSIRQIQKEKGAAFIASCMCMGQNAPIDMLMYYDARPCLFNGIFDFYTLEKRKTYSAFSAFAVLRDLQKQISCKVNDPSVSCIAARNENHLALLLSTYRIKDGGKGQNVRINSTLPLQNCRAFLTDRKNDAAALSVTENTFHLRPNSILLFEAVI